VRYPRNSKLFFLAPGFKPAIDNFPTFISHCTTRSPNGT